MRRVLPAELPELRAHLLKEWQPGNVFHRVATLSRPDAPGYNPEVYAHWERETLRDAILVYVTEPMVALMLRAAQSIPDEVEPTHFPLMAPHGLVVLETPWFGVPSGSPWTDVVRDEDGRIVQIRKRPESMPSLRSRAFYLGDEERGVRVDAFLWGVTHLPPVREWYPEGINAISVSCYGAVPIDSFDGYPTQHVCAERVWSLLGRSDWPIGTKVVDPPWPGIDEQTLSSFIDDRRVFTAFMSLITQRGVANTVEHHAPRAVHRRLARAGFPDGAATYRIVTLREVRDAAGTHSDTAKREWSHRWIVNGHWRNQPYGPNRELRRLQWIAPFVKGPPDKALKPVEKINVWRR